VPLLQELGYSETEIARLHDGDVVRSANM
jgi:hypothetical protein